MKPFNLEEYLKNPNRKVVTREGIDVRIICTDRKSSEAHPVVALCPAPLKHLGEIVCTFCANGEFTMGIESGYDLFFAPEKHERWINLYKDGDIVYTSMDTFNTKKEAEIASCSTCVATVKIEWEE